MLVKLYTFFGFTGIASLLLWMAALVMLVNYLRHARRFEYFVRAFAVAAVGLMLALLNSHFVAAIEVDRSYEMQREFEQREAELNYIKDRAAKVKFAEDDKYDSMDLAGIASKESLSIYENALRAKEKSYLYKQGKPEAQAGKDAAGKPDLLAAIESAESPGQTRTGAKQLPLRDVNLANLWAEVNLWLAFSAFICALIAMALDYIWRFNSVSGIQLPLPMAGRWIDHLVHKKHAVFMSTCQPEAARSLLDFSVRKGETFIYFGPSDPFPGQTSIIKLHLPLKLIRDEFVRIVRPQPSARQPAAKAGRARIFLERMWRIVSSLIAGAGERLRRIAGAFARLASKVVHALVAMPVLRGASGLIAGVIGRHPGLKSFLASAADGTIRMIPVQKLSFSPAAPPFSDNFVFETAWFGKGCFVFSGETMAENMLRSLLRFLEFRARPRATAGRTLNIVWNLNAQLPAPMVRELAALAGETNARFVLLSDRNLPAEYSGVFEEVLPGSAPAEGLSYFARFLKVCQPFYARLKSSLDHARENMRKHRIARQAARDAKAAALREAKAKESARRLAQSAQSGVLSTQKSVPPPAAPPAAAEKPTPSLAIPEPAAAVPGPKPAPKAVRPGQGIAQPQAAQITSARKPEPVFHDSLPVPPVPTPLETDKPSVAPTLKPEEAPKATTAAKVIISKPSVHVAPPSARPAPAKQEAVIPASVPPAPPGKPEPPEIVLKIPSEFASAPKLSIPLPIPSERPPAIAPIPHTPRPIPDVPKPAAIPATQPPAAQAKSPSVAAAKHIVLASASRKTVEQPAPSVTPPPAAQATPPAAAPAPKQAVPVPKPSPIPRPAVAPAVKSTPAVKPVARPSPPLAATIQPVPIVKPAMPPPPPAAPVVKSPSIAVAKPIAVSPVVKPPAAKPSVKPAPVAVVKPKPAAPAPPPKTMPSVKPAATASPGAAQVLKPIPIPKPAEPAPAGKAEIKISDVDHVNRVFKFFCPTCGQKLSAEFDWHGKSATCPRCATKIIIPKVFS